MDIQLSLCLGLYCGEGILSIIRTLGL